MSSDLASDATPSAPTSTLTPDRPVRDGVRSTSGITSGTGGSAHRRPSRLARMARRNALVALGVAVVSALLYTALTWTHWNALASPSWDLGIFSQLAKAYSTFSEPIVPIKGDGFNLLGDHFHPLLVLLGPVWAVWPSGLALLVTQALLIGASAFPITRLAADRYGLGLGATLGAAYALSWGLQGAVAAEFHEIAFAVPLLAFGLVAYLRGHLVAAAVWIGLLVFVKEDLGVTVALFGAIVALRRDHGQRGRVVGLALVVWGVAWLLLATMVILPALNPGGQYDYTDRLGSPLDVFLPATKWVTTAMLALTAGVVGLRSPLILLVLPTLAWRFAGTVEHYWGWGWHYDAVLMPIVVAALIEAAPRDELRRWLAVGVSAGVTLALAFSLPIGQLLDPARWAPSPRLAAAERAVAAVEPGASVETDITLMARLVSRGEVYWLGNTNPVPDFVVLDLDGFVMADNPPADAAQWAEDRYPGEDYEVVFDEGGFVVAERTGR